MIKKTIKFTDYEGVERTEDFYFNLNKAELTEMEVSLEGGLTKSIERVVQAKDAKSIVSIFKELLLKSYGEKSPDGRRFIKSKEISDAFSQTEAYVIIFMELAQKEDYAATFVKGLVPADLQ